MPHILHYPSTTPESTACALLYVDPPESVRWDFPSYRICTADFPYVLLRAIICCVIKIKTAGFNIYMYYNYICTADFLYMLSHAIIIMVHVSLIFVLKWIFPCIVAGTLIPMTLFHVSIFKWIFPSGGLQPLLDRYFP